MVVPRHPHLLHPSSSPFISAQKDEAAPHHPTSAFPTPHHPSSAFPTPPASSRSLYFSTLCVGVFGSDSRNSHNRGT